MNSYFRATCAISDNTRRDFEPSPFAYRPEPASNMELIADVPCSQGETVHTSVQSLTSISCLPLQVLEEILRQATPRSVCALAQTCRSLRSASQSNLVSHSGSLSISRCLHVIHLDKHGNCEF